MKIPGTPSDGIFAEDQRIDEIVVDPTIDDIDALEARCGAREDDVVVDEKIAALDKLHAHLPGEKCVFEIGRIEHAGREHGDRNIFLEGRQRLERREKLLRIMVDGTNARRPKHARKGAAHHFPIRQHVGNAGRHAQIVFQHDESAVFASNQIACRRH